MRTICYRDAAGRHDAHANENANFRIVSSGYFRTMGMRLLQGRELSERDGANAPLVVVINDAMVRAYWPNGDALGKRRQLMNAWARYCEAPPPKAADNVTRLSA